MNKSDNDLTVEVALTSEDWTKEDDRDEVDDEDAVEEAEFDAVEVE